MLDRINDQSIVPGRDSLRLGSTDHDESASSKLLKQRLTRVCTCAAYKRILQLSRWGQQVQAFPIAKKASVEQAASFPSHQNPHSLGSDSNESECSKLTLKHDFASHLRGHAKTGFKRIGQCHTDQLNDCLSICSVHGISHSAQRTRWQHRVSWLSLQYSAPSTIYSIPGVCRTASPIDSRLIL